MKALVQFTKKRFKRLKALLKSFPSGKEKEGLHQIRLEIKKIKVVLQLIHFNNKEFNDHKKYIPFRTVFRESGKIRDAELRKELLDQYTQIHVPFSSSPDIVFEQFVNEVPDQINVISRQMKTIIKQVAKIKSRTYELYLHKKNKELIKLLSEGFTQRDLHGLRKLIKEIIYLTSVKVKKTKIDSFLIESASLIGNWHDKKMLIPWIRTHAANEKGTIKRLQTESNADMQRLRKMVGEYLTREK